MNNWYTTLSNQDYDEEFKKNDLFELSNLGNISEQQKNKLIDKLLILLQKKVAARTQSMTTKEEREDIIQKRKSMIEVIPDLYKIYKEESLNIRQEFIERMNKI